MDISIKNLKDYVFSSKSEAIKKQRAADVLSHDMTVTEKIDGTKLTLIRTNKTSDTNYADNWIVSYKGTVLHPEEFSHLSDKDKEDVKTKSIGISQYAFVFDHLKKIQDNVRKIPQGMEFSIEFAQNKDTLTRTYQNLGGMFLRSYAPVDYRIVGGSLHTSPTGEEITDTVKLKNVAKLLGIKTFPIFFQGRLDMYSASRNEYLSGMNPDWKNPVDVLEKFSEKMLAVPSTLGGKSEGVVLKLDDGRFFKFVQADQYDPATRGEKKGQYAMDPEKTSEYFKSIRAILYPMLKKIGVAGKSDAQILSAANKEISQLPTQSLPRHEKKNDVQVKDDMHDTLRLLLGKEKTIGASTKKIGLIPIAGKPLHIGHWKLIEKAANENDSVVVYTTIKDRVKSGEFPINGKDFIKIWHDIFIPALPENVKVKFVESPVRAVMHELAWFEQTSVQDAIKAPTINLYSDVTDVESNFPEEELNKYPTLVKLRKIKKVGVERSSTVNISGTKMREFLMKGDKDSFIKYLPPVSKSDKEEIWNTLMKQKPKDQMEEFINEMVNSAIDGVLEGGWRDAGTQKTKITPQKVAKIVSAFDEFISQFNSFSKLPPIKTNGPVGSAMYHKEDMKDPNVSYGDIDMQIVFPVETNDRKAQLESDKLYTDKIKEFIKSEKPSYLSDVSDDKDFGSSFLIFNLDGEKIQVDLVISYTISADWAKVRSTPERGLKGFVTGKIMSALSEALNVALSSDTNPYFNTAGGKVVGAAIKKDAIPHHLNPKEVFLEIVRYYGKLAGLKKVDPSKLQGHYGLNEKDPSLVNQCNIVVALANTLEANGIFDKGVIVSKGGVSFRSRDQFIKHVLANIVKTLQAAKTAKKLEKASTPEAMASIEKIKAHADRGIQAAQQLIKESGLSSAMVDPKTVKTVNGEEARASTKLNIIDKTGKDIHNQVSDDIKELTIALNNKVGFWKKNNPYIDNGYIFNGSSQFLMDPEKRNGILSKHKHSFGDIDVIIPKSKLEDLKSFLDSIDDMKPEWTKTSKNMLTSKFGYVGRTRSGRAIPDQLVTLWYYTGANQVVQVDFEGDDMTIDPNGFEKPSDWTKFSKDSPWDDLTVGIKGLAGAQLLRALTRATTQFDNAVVLTPGAAKRVTELGLKEITDKDVSKDVSNTMPSQYTFNPGGGSVGIRQAYKFVATVKYNGKVVNAYRFVEAKETGPKERVTDISKIFEVIFKVPPSAEERATFRSYQGIMRSMKKHLDKKTIKSAMERFSGFINAEPLTPKEKAPIVTAAKTILGVNI